MIKLRLQHVDYGKGVIMYSQSEYSIGYYMYEAIKQAEEAREAGEVPVGAVISFENRIIARGQNRRERDQDPTAHAEILALRAASQKRKDWRLSDCTLYVTLEPCCMCSGAIVAAKIKRLVFGAYDAQAGGCGSAFSINRDSKNWRVDTIGGILERECSELLAWHFSLIRKKSLE